MIAYIYIYIHSNFKYQVLNLTRHLFNISVKILASKKSVKKFTLTWISSDAEAVSPEKVKVCDSNMFSVNG